MRRPIAAASPDADGERLLEHRMPRVERRHQEHAQQCRDGEVVPERRRQPESAAQRERGVLAANRLPPSAARSMLGSVTQSNKEKVFGEYSPIGRDMIKENVS
jgi:hypothetical protein